MSAELPPLELWLVRHGETIRNSDGRLSGWQDVPLTELGREQARWLRPHLAGQRFEGVWSSDLARAVETAELAFGPARADARLREIGFGELEGVPFLEIPEALQRGLLDFEGFQAPGGEGVADLEGRLRAFLAELQPGRHLVFSHGGAIRALTRALGENRFLPNGSLAVVDWSARRLRRVVENELAHRFGG
ncbi:MAG TPA: histidine phosphatase family protein [Myxococcota bacterium]|nr:histidine phosphatase family protein [Myxococcota bacterium]HRY93353.1 histidine phosphatase family protein [Myxococcota bacterium]HSA20152.1 histidine phosphatase family protein [Myxococcota bacterium]